MEYLAFLGFVILVLAVLFVKGIIDKNRQKKQFIKDLYEKYGELPKKEYPVGRIDAIASYFYKHRPEECIDDITWNDLGMNEIFKRLNYAYSSAGEEYLYYALRTPSTDREELDKRERHIKHFTEDEENRVDLLFAISKLGYSGKYSIHNYIENLGILGIRKNIKHYSAILALAVFAGICFLNLTVGLVGIVLIVIYNLIFYFKEKSEIDPYITSFAYIMRLLEVADDISKIKHDAWQNEWEEITKRKTTMNRFKSGSYIVMSSSRMSASGNPLDMIMDYLRMILHLDLIKFNNMLVEVRNHTEDLDALVSMIGYLEMIIAAGAYRKSLENYCIPEEGENLLIENAIHPLLPEAVPNSISTEKCVLLTGSNASGKSTFLKTVALNALLAQTFHTVCALKYVAPFYRIASSMALKDNLLDNESYYIVEIKSIKRILDMSKGSVPVLCFVDEVLRGTNTVERIAASTQILKQLAKEKVTCFAATHDIELADLLSKYFDNHHFEEEIVDGDVRFSYQIKDGKATTRNAIKLLSVMGYDEKVIEAAEKMSSGFLANGVWDNVNYE